MSTQTLRAIVHHGEFSEMLKDGLSNAELDRLLYAADRQGNLIVSKDRIEALLATYKATDGKTLGVRVGITEDFDKQAAAQSLEAALKDNPKREAIAGQIRQLAARTINGREVDFRQFPEGAEMIRDGSSGLAELAREEVKAIACQYIQEVATQKMDECTPPPAPPYQLTRPSWPQLGL